MTLRNAVMSRLSVKCGNASATSWGWPCQPSASNIGSKQADRSLTARIPASAPQSVSVNDGLQLTGCRITNAVKCVPPQNKPELREIKCCNRYLKTELATLGEGNVVLALGNIAHQAVLLTLSVRKTQFPFRHGACHELPNGLALYDSYHCSRYNTQTKRLTETLFNQVFSDIVKNL